MRRRGGAELILGLGVVYHGSMTSWKWIAVAALAFLTGPALADSAGAARHLVNRLNVLGLGPRDLIRALQAIKSSGALQAEIVVR